MNSTIKKQRGFSALIIVLLIALVGVIGFVAWRMYDANQQAAQQQTTQNSNQQTQQPTTDPNEGYVVIKEWGVRFKPMNGLTDVIYSVDDKGVARFSTEALSQYGESCGAGSNGKSPLGRIFRNKGTKEEAMTVSSAFSVQIGDYYYQYLTPQATCADNNKAADDLQTQTINPQFKPSISTLEAAK